MCYTPYEKEVKKALIDKDLRVKDLQQQLNISTSYMCEIFKGTRKAIDKRETIDIFLEIDTKKLWPN